MSHGAAGGVLQGRREEGKEAKGAVVTTWPSPGAHGCDFDGCVHKCIPHGAALLPQWLHAAWHTCVMGWVSKLPRTANCGKLAKGRMVWAALCISLQHLTGRLLSTDASSSNAQVAVDGSFAK